MGNAAKLLTLLVCCGSGAALAVYVATALDSADSPVNRGDAPAATASAEHESTQAVHAPLACSQGCGDTCSDDACQSDAKCSCGIATGAAMAAAWVDGEPINQAAASLPAELTHQKPATELPAPLSAPRLLPDVAATAVPLVQPKESTTRPSAPPVEAQDTYLGSANQPRRIVPRRSLQDGTVRPAASEQAVPAIPAQAVESQATKPQETKRQATANVPRVAQGGANVPALPDGLTGELGNLLRAAQEFSDKNNGNLVPAMPATPNQSKRASDAESVNNQPARNRRTQAAEPNGPSSLSIRRTDDLPPPGPATTPRVPAGPVAPPQFPPAAGPHQPGGSITREGDDHLELYARNQDIRDVLALLSEQSGLNIVATRSVTGQVSVSLSNVTVQKALEAILRSTGYIARQEGRFIYVGTPADFTEMEQAYDRVGTRIFRPYYVSAAELQVLITPLLTPEVGKVSVSTPSAQGIASNDGEVGGDSFSGGETLLVQDRETVLREIEQVVREVDCPPMQVAIEAMILSVTLNDKYECGVDFQFLRNQGTIRFGIGAPPTAIDGVTFENGGLKFAYLDSSLGAFIKALETIGDTSVIATPRVMVLNKQRAEVLIGGQLGYVNTTVTETTATQSVAFLEVGTQLRIRPFISPDGLIRMEVHPELSTGTVRIEQGMTLPDKQVTKVTSNVMVRDGSTVIIGGLMRDNLKSDVKQMPLMGNLPLLGKLFRTTAEETQRTEIVVLLTPRIVVQDELAVEGEQAACEFHRRHAIQADNMSYFSRDYLSEKYCRLAKQAYKQGDRERAWRYIQLAVDINPGNRNAIELRSRMAAGVDPHMLEGAPPGEIEGVLPMDATGGHLILPEGVPAHEVGPQIHEPYVPGVVPNGPHLPMPGPPHPSGQPPQTGRVPAAARRPQAPRPAQQTPAAQRSATATPQNNTQAGPKNRKTQPDAMSAWVLDELAE